MAVSQSLTTVFLHTTGCADVLTVTSSRRINETLARFENEALKYDNRVGLVKPREAFASVAIESAGP